MKTTATAVGVALMLSLVSGQARAQDTADLTAPPAGPNGSDKWSLLTGRTMGEGGDGLIPELGYPGVQATFLHGVSNRMDLGGRFTFNYGSTVTLGLFPGIGLQGVLKFNLLNRGKISLGMQLAPGFGFYFANPSNDAGLVVLFPVQFMLGIHDTDTVGVVIGADLDMAVLISFNNNGAAFAMPITVGPGVEVKLDKDIAFTFNSRFGPGIAASSLGSGVGLALRVQMGIAIKL